MGRGQRHLSRIDPGYEPEIEAPSRRQRSRLRRLLFDNPVMGLWRGIWRRVPSPPSVLLFLFWGALAVTVIHTAGALLMDPLPQRSQVFTATLGYAVFLPLFIAPRPTLEPISWGIALNALALVVMGMATIPTQDALRRNGDWDISWLETRGAPAETLQVMDRVHQASLWGLKQVPVEKLRGILGNAGLPYWEVPGTVVAGQDTSESRPGLASTADGDIGPAGQNGPRVQVGSLQTMPMEIPRGIDDAFWERRSAAPSAEEVLRQEQRLGQILNFERSRAGLTSLLMREDLSRVARAHATNMVRNDFFDHVDPEGHDVQKRAEIALVRASRLHELLGRVEGSQDLARDLLTQMVRTAGDRNRLFNHGVAYEAMGVGLSCAGSICCGTVLLME